MDNLLQFKERITKCMSKSLFYVSKFLDLKDNNSKKLWSFVKTKCKDQCGIPLYNIMDNHTLIVLYNKANLFNSHFSSVFTKEDASYVPELSNISSLPDMPPLHINTELEELATNLLLGILICINLLA